MRALGDTSWAAISPSLAAATSSSTSCLQTCAEVTANTRSGQIDETILTHAQKLRTVLSFRKRIRLRLIILSCGYHSLPFLHGLWIYAR
jgi:hypothetical protein